MTTETHRIRWQFINDPPAHMRKSGHGLPMSHDQAVKGFRKLLRENDGIIYSVEPITKSDNEQTNYQHDRLPVRNANSARPDRPQYQELGLRL